MALEALKTCRLIKSEDLNHHGTLFAGRCAEWFVESGFIAVAAKLDPRTVVCLKIHGMEFLHPVTLGSVLTFREPHRCDGTQHDCRLRQIVREQDPRSYLFRRVHHVLSCGRAYARLSARIVGQSRDARGDRTEPRRQRVAGTQEKSVMPKNLSNIGMEVSV